MALGEIPPWLSVNPRDFTQASEAGARAGTAAAEQVQSGQLEGRRIGVQAADAQRQAALEQERLANAQEEFQQRQSLATQAAARKYQAQAGYANAIKAGADPITAMMQFGPQMGESLAGLGPLALDQFRTRQASLPPQPLMGPDGKPVGYTYGGNLHMLPKATIPKQLSDVDKLQVTQLQKELSAIDAQTVKLASLPIGDAGAARALRIQKDEKQKKLDSILGKYDEKSGDEADNQTDDENGPQQSDIEYLVAHPEMAKNFEKEFGKGSSAQYLQLPNATNTPAPAGQVEAPLSQADTQ